MTQGVRAPSELINIKISDFHNDFKEVHIRDEISKTFGRRIKLMLSSDLVKRYIRNEQLEAHDYLFTFKPSNVNRVIKNTAKKLFGDGVSPAGDLYSNLTLYDFRHCACCYWLPRYKSESALKYRFGWKKSDKIHYYSELLGMRDTITEDDMLVDLSKTEIEKKLVKSENEKNVLLDRIEVLEKQIGMIMPEVEKMKIAFKEL